MYIYIYIYINVYISYVFIYIIICMYVYMAFILSESFSILYRTLARVGFEPTTSCLPCTRS